MSRRNSNRPAVSPGCWNNFRRYGIRPLKSLLSSGVDVASDWIFYLNVVDLNQDNLEVLEPPLLVFCVVSSVMAALLVYSLMVDFRRRCKIGAQCARRGRPSGGAADVFGVWVKRVLGLEILEEIAQFVLTAMVTDRRGKIDGFAVFNLTTSGFNFVLNLLDMIEIGGDEDEEEEASSASASQQRGSSRGGGVAVTGVGRN